MVNDFKDHCPNGLQVEGKSQIGKLATAVSASEEVILQAVQEKADVLLVHHGLLWYRDDPVIQRGKRRKLAQLLGNDLSLVAYHLPLDAHPEWGNNWRAALDMGWENLQPFGWTEGKSIGVQGEVQAQSAESFRKKLEKYYDHPAHVVSGGPELIRSAALISGGAHRQIDEAIEAGVDAFITGSFDEPIWHIAHEEGIHFFALGHASTERIGPRAFGEYLSKHFGIPHLFIDIANPF